MKGGRRKKVEANGAGPCRIEFIWNIAYAKVVTRDLWDAFLIYTG